MTDLEFERRMNPMALRRQGPSDRRGKKQFPDLAGADAAPVSLNPAGGGKTVAVNPAVLQQAAQNAFALRDSVKTECDQPGEHVNTAAGSPKGWNLGGALTAAWGTWTSQPGGPQSTVGDIGTNLRATARSYSKTDSDIQAHFNQAQGASS